MPDHAHDRAGAIEDVFTRADDRTRPAGASVAAGAIAPCARPTPAGAPSPEGDRELADALSTPRCAAGGFSDLVGGTSCDPACNIYSVDSADLLIARCTAAIRSARSCESARSSRPHDRR
jgi:hypothetical protein